jgi:hypothetical protein
MLVYRDIITGDEIITDSFNVQQAKDTDGEIVPGLLFVESLSIPKGEDNVDVGCGNAFGGDGEEAGGAQVEMVNNVMEGFQYTETQVGTASDFKAWLKEYMNAVVEKLKETIKDAEKRKAAVQGFKASAPGIAKFFIKQYNDVQFYLTASFNPESMVFSIYPEGGLTPNFYFIEGGVEKIKF